MDWEARRQSERGTDYWGQDKRPKAGEKTASEAEPNTQKPSLVKPVKIPKPRRLPIQLNSYNAKLLHARDEKNTARSNFIDLVRMSLDDNCDFETRLVLAKETIKEIEEQGNNRNAVLTVNLLNQIITNYAHNPHYLRKDPDLKKLASLVVAFGAYDLSIFKEHYLKTTKAGEPSRLAKAVTLALEEAEEAKPGIKKYLYVKT